MKFLLYLFPAMINFVVSGVFFYVTQRFVDAGASPLMTAMVVPTWAITYCISNIVIAKVVREHNAAALIITGGTIIAGASLGFICLDALKLMLIWTGMLGIGFGFYCSPFQVMCRALEEGSDSGVAMATGKYTCAWSVGFAAGALTFGLLNYKIAFMLCFAVGASVAIGVALINRKLKRGQQNVAETLPAETAAEIAADPFPDYAWLGWIVGLVINFSVTQLRSMLQPHGVAIELVNAKGTMALALMMVSLIQGLTGLALIKSKVWMYKIIPVSMIGLLGAAAMGIFCTAQTLPGFLTASFCYGIYSGCGYFFFVFYALANPLKAGRNAAVNEIMVSVASICAPIIGGAVVEASGLSWSPFAMAGSCIILATLFHVIVFAADRRRKNALKENIL